MTQLSRSNDPAGPGTTTRVHRSFSAPVFIFALSIFFALPYALRVTEEMPSDVAEYEELAVNLLRGSGYILRDHFRAYRTPGLPLFLAAIYGIWGERHYVIVRVIQTGLLGLGNVLLYRLGCRLGSTRLGLIAGLLGAASHEFVFWVAKPASEFLYTFLLLCSTVTFVESIARRSCGWALGAGFLAGAAFLTRPIALVIVPLWVLGLFVFMNRGRQLRLAVCLLLSFAVMALPWYIRNFMLYHRLFTDSHAGLAIWHGNHPTATVGGWYGTVWPTPSAQTLIEEQGLNEVEVSDLLRREAIGFMRERPWRTVKMAFGRIGFMMVGSKELLTNVPFDYLWIWPGMEVELVKYSWPIFLLSLLGLGITVRRAEPFWYVVWAILVGSLIVHAIYAAVPRMRVPLLPALYLCTARGACGIADYFLNSVPRSLKTNAPPAE